MNDDPALREAPAKLGLLKKFKKILLKYWGRRDGVKLFGGRAWQLWDSWSTGPVYCTRKQD